MKIAALLMGLGVVILMGLSSCNDDKEAPITRAYRMGFANSAPRFDSSDVFIQALNLWTTRADAAIISTEVPWTDLLNGEDPVDYVVANYQELTAYYRSKGLTLWVYIDPANGLDRSTDSQQLIDAGKSIADVDAQQIYQRFVILMDSILVPEHLGLALETNLIRDLAPAPIYNSIKDAANDVADELSSRHTQAKLSVSLQVEQAWGKFSTQTYEGVAQDFADFPFMQEAGLSSYPYFVFDKPSDIPIDYYSRLVEDHHLPVFISEGGWSSHTIVTPFKEIPGTEQAQKDYITLQQKLLVHAHAIAVFQLTFTDLDTTAFPPDIPGDLSLFAYLGMVDINLDPKPALAAWDDTFHIDYNGD